MTSLSADRVLALRMASLLLDESSAGTPADIVRWFGAMQAQDLASGQWSFGVRLPGSTVEDIEQATRDRHIVRTWPMRGTVHFVPPEDAKWMLDLTGVRALQGVEARRQLLGLTEADVNRAANVLASALCGGKQLTRAQCVEHLVRDGVHTAPGHSYHLLWYASQIGVTCIGPQLGNEQTFVLLNEWVPKPRLVTRDEGLATLALRYFQSHGPTTRQDFAGWTGLTAGDAKRGIEAAGDALTSVDVEGIPHIVIPSQLDASSKVLAKKRTREVLLLPGFDEYMLGFKDRSLMVSDQFKQRIVPGNNGVFMPTVVLDGRVIGTWKREIKRKGVELRALPFDPLTKKQRSSFIDAGNRYSAYLQLEPSYPDL